MISGLPTPRNTTGLDITNPLPCAVSDTAAVSVAEKSTRINSLNSAVSVALAVKPLDKSLVLADCAARSAMVLSVMSTARLRSTLTVIEATTFILLPRFNIATTVIDGENTPVNSAANSLILVTLTVCVAVTVRSALAD